MNKFDEYKFFAQSTQFLTDKRQSATQTYLTVNSAIFAVLAFLIKDLKFTNWDLVIITIPIFIAGMLVCWIWRRMITQYKQLINWRYDQLMKMERVMPDSYQIYIKEWEDFYKQRSGKEKFGFSRLEIILPILFMILYVIYLSGLILATALINGQH